MVVDPAIHHLRDDGVADGQHGEELADDRGGGVVALQVLVQQRVFQPLVRPGPVVDDLPGDRLFGVEVKKTCVLIMYVQTLDSQIVIVNLLQIKKENVPCLFPPFFSRSVGTHIREQTILKDLKDIVSVVVRNGNRE